MLTVHVKMKVFVLILIQIFCASIKADFSYPNCEFAGTSCLDCYTQKYCMDFFILVHWSSTTCSSISGLTPYCDPSTNTCTNVLPSECTALSFYNCLRDGIFPDLTDCSFYYQCSNNVSEESTCPDNYVYKQEWGKCVYQLSDSDCVKIPQCTLINSIATYPGDPSLYYQCEAGTLSLSACAETEQFNLQTKTCESICESAVDGTVVANPRNCQSYYSCQGSIAVIKLCESGYGFNVNTNKCEWGYQNLCNELALLDGDISDVAELIPVYGTLWTPLKTLFNALNFNPLTLLLTFGVSDNSVSTTILIADYIYKNRALPSSVVSLVVNIILPYLPEQIRVIIQTILQMGLLGMRMENGLILEDVAVQNETSLVVGLGTPRQKRGAEELIQLKPEDVLRNFETFLESKVSLEAVSKVLGQVTVGQRGETKQRQKRNENDLIRQYLEVGLRSVNFESLAGLQGKTPSQVIVEILRQFFKIPDAQLPLVAYLIQLQIPALSKELNNQVGLPLFKIQGGKALTIDVAVVDGAVYNILGEIAQKLYPDNRFLAEIFKLYARQLYLAHHDALVNVVNALQVSFEKV